MKLSLAFLVAFALFSAVLAADQNNQKNSSGKQNVCYLCIKSYIDCFNLFGIQGCTDKNAEHYTYCRECTGVDPPCVTLPESVFVSTFPPTMLAFSVRARWVAAREFTPRAFHATCLRSKPVRPAYEQYLPESTDRLVAERTKALVICHGLFGSKQNWRSLAKSMAKAFGVTVYTLDMRNHGSSPHCEEMTYSDMADDVKTFLQEQKLSNVALVGHSMGGKVAMTVALDPALPKNTLSHLVSVDMSPAEGAISPEFMEYIRCMIKIDEMNVTSRSEADKELQKIEPNLPVRQFLLTNLERDDETGVMRFRIPLKVLLRALEHIGRFPYAPPKDASSSPERVWHGPTLFVKGEHSKYINRRNVPLCRAYFPAMELVTLPTGHWCQSEKPAEFMQALQAFLERDA